MTTARIRARVSLAATMAVAVALGACAPSHPGVEAPPRAVARPLAIRFDNDARDYVHVYLVGERRQWLLGRVEAGAIAMLRIPAAALADEPGRLRLAVITGGRITLGAAREARAQLTIAQPASHILSQEWRFAQGQLTSVALRRSPAAAGRW
jgi:hypothetical protein